MPSGNKIRKFQIGGYQQPSNVYTAMLTGAPSAFLLESVGKVTNKVLPSWLLNAMTYVSPLNYLAAISKGSIDPKVGEQEIATWHPTLLFLGRMGEIATGPKVVKATTKGIKGVGNLAVDVAGLYGNKTARGWSISKAINNAVKDTNPRTTRVPSRNLFRTMVFKGGDVTDPYSSFFTTDRVYASKYGKVTPYMFESKSIAKAREPLMGTRDPVSMDMFIYNNTKRNPSATAIIGHDAVTGEFTPSKGVEIYSMSPSNIFPILLKNSPTSLKFFERQPSRLTEAERAGISKGDRNLPKHIRYPKVNWDPNNWFIKISKRDSYFPEEAEELASNVPEYEIIEKRLFNEGKLTTDSKGNVIVKGSRMTPQEYIMRLSKAFLKMNPEHHYTGVKKEYVNNFENISSERPYDVWTDKLSPRNVEEYAYSGLSGNTIYSDIDLAITSLRDIKSGGLAKDFDSELLFSKKLLDEKVIGKDEYLQKIESTNAARDNLMKQAVDNLVKLLLKRKTDPLNGGKIYDVTYPKQTIETPIFDVHGAKWSNILKDDITSKDSRYFTNSSADRVMTDEIVEEGRPLGVGVTHIDNVMDSSNGTLLNEAIIDGSVTPVKSVLGNTGKFDTSGINKWKLFRSITPFIGGYTLYNLNKTHNNYE